MDKSCVCPSRHALLQFLLPVSLLALHPREWHFTAYSSAGFDGHGGPNAGGPVCYLTYFSEAQEHQVTCTRSSMSQ